MSIVTKSDFKRIHNNGTVLVEVPAGTELTISPFGGSGAWKVTSGDMVFHVGDAEYRQLTGK